MMQISTQAPSLPISSSNQSQAQMTSLEIAELVGLRHDNVKRTIKTLICKGVITLPQIEKVENNQSLSANNKTAAYIFTGEAGRLDSITVVAQLSPEFTRQLVKRWDELEQKTSVNIPDFNNPALAARAWAEQYEQRLAVEQQRDHAIATKAQIGSRREASAMATASREKRRAQKLEIELGKSKEWVTIKRAESLSGKKFNWRDLKETSVAMGYAIKSVFDHNYGSVKAYHRDVWRTCFGLEF